jgi:hypothetical protein
VIQRIELTNGAEHEPGDSDTEMNVGSIKSATTGLPALSARA